MQTIGMIVNCLQGGGAERCAADLSVYFYEHGYNVVFFTDLSCDVGYNYKGELVNFTYNLDGSGKSAIEKKVMELHNLKEQYNIDISISFMQFANYINILAKGRDKIILTTHSVNSEYAKYDKSVFWADGTFRDLYQYADLITFPSEYCQKEWIENYGDKNNITKTIYNPVHAMTVKEDENKKNIVISIGRMHSIKRQWHIIRAFKAVKEKCPDCKLIILGDGELRPKLEKLVLELGLKNDVKMVGNVTNVQDYLKKAKIFTITSRLESLSCASLEALSAGVPVVACDCPGGIREVLNISCEQGDILEPIRGECGILVPDIKEYYTEQLTKEEIQLADEIVYLLKNNELRRNMAEKARERAEKFSIEHIGLIWLNAIEEVNKKDIKITPEFETEKLKSLDAIEMKADNTAKMYKAYYQLLEKWMLLREKNISIRQYFEERRIKNIIIYGMGKMAHHLIADLSGSDINIVCVIDKRLYNINEAFPMINGDKEIPEADCIVITPVYEEDSIRQRLSKKTDIPMISLAEIVSVVRKEEF
ncbi:MAG: glycosyltransferase [Clostridiales bacterium]|nr:glycosyltransferase [Clostridiales bacterium]